MNRTWVLERLPRALQEVYQIYGELALIPYMFNQDQAREKALLFMKDQQFTKSVLKWPLEMVKRIERAEIKPILVPFWYYPCHCTVQYNVCYKSL